MSDPPSAPQNPEITEMYRERAILTWAAPASDGGSPVTGYYVERRLTSSSRWVPVNKLPVAELTLEAGELIEDEEYEFRIAAQNKIGRGPESSPTKPTKAKDPWGGCHISLHFAPNNSSNIYRKL
jgi:titin